MNQGNSIGFNLLDIRRRSFSTVPGTDLATAEFALEVGLSFGATPQHKTVAAVPLIRFLRNDQAFVSLELETVFQLTDDSWESMCGEDGVIRIPLGFAQHLGVIAIGTARGFLSAKLEGDPDYQGLILPTVDLTKSVTEDIRIEFYEEE